MRLERAVNSSSVTYNWIYFSNTDLATETRAASHPRSHSVVPDLSRGPFSERTLVDKEGMKTLERKERTRSESHTPWKRLPQKDRTSLNWTFFRGILQDPSFCRTLPSIRTNSSLSKPHKQRKQLWLNQAIKGRVKPCSGRSGVIFRSYIMFPYPSNRCIR